MIKSVIAGVSVGDDQPVRIMGVINVSPESFYKGSAKTTRESIIEAVNAFAKAGVDFLDMW